VKKLRVVALVAVVVLALTTPVSAQSDFEFAFQNTLNSVTGPLRQMGQNLCANSLGTGNGMEASWCYGAVINPMTGRVEGFNPNSVAGQQARRYASNGYSHRRPSVGRQILGSLLGRNQYPYGYNGYGAYGLTIVRDDTETPGKCVERTTKAFKKAKVVVDPALIIAGCTGSNVPAPSTQPMEQEIEQTSYQTLPNQAVPQGNYPKGIFKDLRKGVLCNNTDAAVTILIDGTPVGQLGAGKQVSLASLPNGKLEFQRIN
jgi:hypothetical protein